MRRHLAGGLCAGVVMVLAAGFSGQVQADERTQRIADLQGQIRSLDEQIGRLRWRQEQFRIVSSRAREIRDSVKMPDGSSVWKRLEYLQKEDRRLKGLGYGTLDSTRRELIAELRSLSERYETAMDERIRTDGVMGAQAISSYDELLAQYGSQGTKRLTDKDMAKFNDLMNERRRLEAELERLQAAVVPSEADLCALLKPSLTPGRRFTRDPQSRSDRLCMMNGDGNLHGAFLGKADSPAAARQNALSLLSAGIPEISGYGDAAWEELQVISRRQTVFHIGFVRGTYFFIGSVDTRTGTPNEIRDIARRVDESLARP